MINSNDLFPDYSAGIEAAVEYANAELNGLEGRDIEVQVCTIDYNTPDDTQRCANELAAAQVDFAVSTLNQFGTHMQILPRCRHPGARRHRRLRAGLHDRGRVRRSRRAAAAPAR